MDGRRHREETCISFELQHALRPEDDIIHVRAPVGHRGAVRREHPIPIQDARSTDLDPTTPQASCAVVHHSSGPARRKRVAAAFRCIPAVRFVGRFAGCDFPLQVRTTPLLLAAANPSKLCSLIVVETRDSQPAMQVRLCFAGHAVQVSTSRPVYIHVYIGVYFYV
ncbi:hypothetical protein CPLU01_01353 [Colletotrichum plurivorum]|uniref:Uncharacterized protein n=1 Tax=Colletotrichum plurivorum TaxID=2175906 RepID=A0A8H6NPA3_9PEZI|nr:hypothetical protein CPLU01_01353 [Colletotrichum plurivorum]